MKAIELTNDNHETHRTIGAGEHGGYWVFRVTENLECVCECYACSGTGRFKGRKFNQ